MDEVTVHPNLRYSEVDDPFLLMDIYTPPGVSKDASFPVVVLLHGAAGAQYKPKTGDYSDRGAPDWGCRDGRSSVYASLGLSETDAAERPPSMSLTPSTTFAPARIPFTPIRSALR